MTTFEIFNFHDTLIKDNYFINKNNLSKGENKFSVINEKCMNKKCNTDSTKIKKVFSQDKISNTTNYFHDDKDFFINLNDTDNLSMFDSLLSKDDSKNTQKKENSSISIKKLHKLNKINYKHEKNFKTTYTSSSITSDSFELEFEYVNSIMSLNLG